MQVGEVPRDVIESIIGADRSTRRFEKFAADLFWLREGIHYVTTAPTDDGGVDAEGQVELAEGAARVCATTQKRGCRSKGCEDIDAVAKLSTATARLRVCFTADVEAAVLRDVKAHAQRAFPKADIETHGLSALTDLAFRHQKAFLDNYGRDLDLHTLSYVSRFDADEDTNQVDLLRLAVTTVFHPDVLKQRQLLMEGLVVLALDDNRPHSSRDVAMRVSKGLKLTLPPHSSYIASTLQALQGSALIKHTHEGWRLSDTGLQRRDEIVVNGTRNSVAGRSSFEEMLGSAGDLLSAGQMTIIWKVVQNRLASLFADNGLKIISEIQSVQHADSKDDSAKDRVGVLQSSIKGLLDEIEVLNIPTRAKVEVAAALGAMFNDRTSRAYLWIGQLGVKYVIICGLGLDPEINARLRERIKTWVVVPDTHVVLSYLCQGDAGHEACKSVLAQLRNLGSSMWAAEAVLAEAVNHAEIATRSFLMWEQRVREMRVNFPEVHPALLIEETDNAFVKGFAFEAGPVIRRSDWRLYIGQFSGSRRLDYTNIERILRDELNAELKEDSIDVKAAGRAFADKLSRNRSADDSSTAKCEWDGRLLANCVLRLPNEAKSRSVLVISESEQIKSAFHNQIAKEKRRNFRIVDPASLACTLATVPNTSINLDSCRLLLFNAIELPIAVQAEPVLAQAFSSSARLLRRQALKDALESAILGQNTDVR